MHIIQFLTGVAYFMSYPHLGAAGLTHIKGYEETFKADGTIERVKTDSIACPGSIQGFQTVFSEPDWMCYYITPDQFKRIPHESRD